MGVEELDDDKSSSDEATAEKEALETGSDSDDSDSDDSDSDGPCTCGMCETSEDEESNYEDMPILKDQREPEKTEVKEPKKETEEWEVVDDDEPAEDEW